MCLYTSVYVITIQSHSDAVSLLTLHLSYTQSVTNFKSDLLMLASKADELASSNQRERYGCCNNLHIRTVYCSLEKMVLTNFRQ